MFYKKVTHNTHNQFTWLYLSDSTCPTDFLLIYTELKVSDSYVDLVDLLSLNVSIISFLAFLKSYYSFIQG